LEQKPRWTHAWHLSHCPQLTIKTSGLLDESGENRLQIMHLLDSSTSSSSELEKFSLYEILRFFGLSPWCWRFYCFAFVCLICTFVTWFLCLLVLVIFVLMFYDFFKYFIFCYASPAPAILLNVFLILCVVTFSSTFPHLFNKNNSAVVSSVIWSFKAGSRVTWSLSNDVAGAPWVSRIFVLSRG
jgi:hypothetical protein